MAAVSASQLVATGLFAMAVVHTFSTELFKHVAHRNGPHAGLWHILGEVEVVFGFWAMVLVVFLGLHVSKTEAVGYLESRNFTEPLFVFAIMVIAASRPVLEAASSLIRVVSMAIPISRTHAMYFTTLSIGPLLGSLITEPAAMTLCALMLRRQFMRRDAPETFKYATLAVLFVNISIGGTLTPYAAPPVIMVAGQWGWDIAFMASTFGWKSALAVVVNATVAVALFDGALRKMPVPLVSPEHRSNRPPVPLWLTAMHLVLLGGVVVLNHHPAAFMAVFLLFLGMAEAYSKHQDRLILREGLLVAFFLAGIVTLGGMQAWWLEPLLSGMSDILVYFGATLLTAITDNAALTYLGSLVDGTTAEFKYALVAGAVTGGGLTVIANAPNPAGYSLLKGRFEDEAISHARLFVYALPPTLVAVAAFRLLPG